MDEQEKTPEEMTATELIQAVTLLRQQAEYVHNSAYTDGLTKSFRVLTSSISEHLDVEDSEEDQERAFNIMDTFLSDIGKSHWDNPFLIVKKWDVTVSLDSTSFTVTVEADDEDDALDQVKDNVQISNKRMSFTVEYQGESMDCDFEDDECTFDEDDHLDNLQYEVTAHTD